MSRQPAKEVAQRIRATAPDQKIVYMSGYSHEALAQHGVSAASSRLLQKPFTRLDLLRKIRQVLKSPGPP